MAASSSNSSLLKMGTPSGNITDGIPSASSLMLNDLIMLENQIPFFVLEELLISLFTRSEEPDLPPLVDLAAKCLVPCVLPDHQVNAVSLPEPPLHLLHLCIMSMSKPAQPSTTSSSLARLNPVLFISFFLTCLSYLRIIKGGQGSGDRGSRTIPCAAELQDAGVKFTKKDSKDFRDITFNEGVLEIAPLVIRDTTKSCFMNLMAFEQFINDSEDNRQDNHDHPGEVANRQDNHGHPGQVPEKSFTRYSYFMDCLINTSNDVAILQKHGIIENRLGSEEDVALLINHLSEYVIPADGKKQQYLDDVLKQTKDYCALDWPKYRVILLRDYFDNPWATLSLAAAVVLLVLTIVQTFFAVYPYYHPSSSKTTSWSRRFSI